MGIVVMACHQALGMGSTARILHLGKHAFYIACLAILIITLEKARHTYAIAKEIFYLTKLD